MIANRRTRATDEGFMKSHWREFMAWSYGIVCLWDFMLAPIFFAWFSHHTNTPYVVWVPTTTSGGGLYHVAMGAIIGVSSYGKTQENVTNTNAFTASVAAMATPSSAADTSSDDSSTNDSTPAPVVSAPTPPTIPVAPASVITHAINPPPQDIAP